MLNGDHGTNGSTRMVILLFILAEETPWSILREKVTRNSEDRISRELYVYRKLRETADLKIQRQKLEFNFTKYENLQIRKSGDLSFIGLALVAAIAGINTCSRQ
jgi:hypothetical protein